MGMGVQRAPLPHHTSWHGLIQLPLPLVLSGPSSLLPAHGPRCCLQSLSRCPGDELKAKPVLG